MIVGRKDITVLGGGQISISKESVSTSGSSQEFGYHSAESILRQYFGNTKKIMPHYPG